MDDLSFILTHLGEERENYFHAISPPIIQSSNFGFKTVNELRTKIVHEKKHHIYTRGNNPTTSILRQKLASLEHADDSLVFGSGSAAVAAAFLSQLKSGDHIISINSAYSWTIKLISAFLPRFGVTHTFVQGNNVKDFELAIRPNTKIIYLESPSTMLFELQDLQAVAKLAKANNIITILDNSCASAYFQKPLDLGIDIVVHSGTKYFNGHSDVVMGVVCAKQSIIDHMFASEFMTLGAILSPHDAYLAIRGLRTYQLRMERAQQSGLEVATFLNTHPKIQQVNYVWGPWHPQHDLAKQQMNGAGGLFSILLNASSIPEVEAFVERLKRFIIAVSWGGHESLILPVAAFYNIPGNRQPQNPWNLIRIYIGLEDPKLLIEDLNQSLEHVH